MKKKKTKTAGNTDKKTGFKPKKWVKDLIDKHKVLVDGLKDR